MYKEMLKVTPRVYPKFVYKSTSVSFYFFNLYFIFLTIDSPE